MGPGTSKMIDDIRITQFRYSGRKFTNISTQELQIIMHSKRSLLFENDVAWVKKGDSGEFDVTMGSFDGAETCELVGLYILDTLGNKFGNENIGLYRDDGLACLKTLTDTNLTS